MRHSENVEEQYCQLFEEWKFDRRPTSISADLMKHSSYQKIVNLGWEVIPLIFKDLPEEPHRCFWLLQALSGENPISESDKGQIQKMIEAWQNWGRDHGYLAS